MSYGLNLPTSGALGWWDNSYDADAPGGSKAVEVAADTTSSGRDSWTGFWQGLTGTVVSYALQKDAAKSGLNVSTPAASQPVYVQQPGAGQAIPPGLLLVGLGVLVFMAVKD